MNSTNKEIENPQMKNLKESKNQEIDKSQIKKLKNHK